MTRKLITKLNCWYYGHETPPDYYGDNTCIHCGKFIEAGATIGVRNEVQFWWNYRRPQWMRLRFYQKCRDCGKRFNQHSEDCPPF